MKTLAIIEGGTSSEREISLMSSENIKPYLNNFKTFTIHIDSSGNWLCGNKSINISLTKENFFVKNNIEYIFFALHGIGYEDGTIQEYFEMLKIPFYGSSSLVSQICFDKKLCSTVVAKLGIKVPKEFTKQDFIDATELHVPLVAKPNKNGSSVGLIFIRNNQDINLIKDLPSDVVIQQCIMGREFTCGVINGKALPVVEIITDHGKAFDYHAKYFDVTTQEICPAQISQKLTEQIQTLAETVHKKLGCKDITRTDVIVDKDENIYFLEINTLPGLTKSSLIPKMIVAQGDTVNHVLENIINAK